MSLRKIALGLGMESTAVLKGPRARPTCESDVGLGLRKAVRYQAR